MSTLYLHPALTSDPQLIWAIEQIMRVTAIIEGHRVRLVPQRKPQIAEVTGRASAACEGPR